MAKQKRRRKSETPLRQRIIDSALALAAAQGWADLSLKMLARHAKCTLKELEKIFPDKAALLAGIFAWLDEEALKGAGVRDTGEPPRDALFDLLMDRFDVLNDHRAAFASILDSFRPDPQQAFDSLPHLCRAMTATLAAAGLESDGVKGALRVLGLTVVYLDVLRVWKEDDSADMAKTMAALDRDLGRAEQAAGFLGL